MENFDYRSILVDSGSIVHCEEEARHEVRHGVDFSRVLEHLLGHPQAECQGHGGEVGPAGQLRDDLRGGGDENDAQLQLRLEQASFHVLLQE